MDIKDFLNISMDKTIYNEFMIEIANHSCNKSPHTMGCFIIDLLLKNMNIVYSDNSI